jgi:hypothetical protein
VLVNLGFRQNFEQRSLAHLRQADNAGFHIRSVVALAQQELRARASPIIQETTVVSLQMPR